MCLIPAPGALRAILCLRVGGGAARSFITQAEPAWCVNSFQLWVVLVLTFFFLCTFYHLTTFPCYLESLNRLSYRFQISIFPNDFTPKLDVGGFDHRQHDDCVVQCDGKIAMKRLLSALGLEISEVHVG